MTVAWQPELQRACEALEWLVVEARGGDAWGCLLVFRGDAWGVLLYQSQWIDELSDRSPARLRRYVLDLIRSPLDEVAARELLAAAPDRRCETLDAPGDDMPQLGDVVAWPERDWLIADAGRDFIVWDRATRQAVTRNPISAVYRYPYLKPVIDPATPTIAVRDGMNEFALWSLDTFELERVYRGHVSPVRGIAFVSDGRLLSAGEDRTLRSWDRASGACLRTYSVGPLTCLAASPDGGRFAAGGSHGERGCVWVTRAGLELVHTLPAGRLAVRSLAWHPDGRRLVAGGADHAVRMLDAGTGEIQRVWKGHGYTIESVAVSADGERVASGSNDGQVRVWATASDECLAHFSPGPKIEGVCFAGDRIYASTEDGYVIELP